MPELAKNINFPKKSGTCQKFSNEVWKVLFSIYTKYTTYGTSDIAGLPSDDIGHICM